MDPRIMIKTGIAAIIALLLLVPSTVFGQFCTNISLSSEGYFSEPFPQEGTIGDETDPADPHNANGGDQPGYRISGRIVNYTTQSGIPGVTVLLTGRLSETAQQIAPHSSTSSDNGTYVFAGLSSGLYTVIPSLAGYAFEPSSQAVTIGAADVDSIDFIATTGVTVSGTILFDSNIDGDPAITNISVQLFKTGLFDDSATPVLTVNPDNKGRFIFINVDPGFYSIRPSLEGYGFTPLSQTITVLNRDISDIGFRGKAGLYVAGKVSSLIGIGVPDVPVLLTGDDLKQTVTSSSGIFSFTGLQAGEYTVSIGDLFYTVFPAEKSFLLVESIDDVNFIAYSKCQNSLLNIPSIGAEGSLVNIYGTNFGWSPPSKNELVSIDGIIGNAGVYFGTRELSTWTKARVVSWSNFKVVVEAPPGMGIVRTFVVRAADDNDTFGCTSANPATNFFMYLP